MPGKVSGINTQPFRAYFHPDPNHSDFHKAVPKNICPRPRVRFLDDVRCLGSQPASYGSDFNIAELQSNCIYHMIIHVRRQQLV